jgi:hypothetical protein
MHNALKIILSGLLLGCLFDMPYGYFQFVRFFSSYLFIYWGLKEQNNETIKYVYFALALLFQPFIKIALGRSIWNIVDVIVAGSLIMSFVKDYNSTAKIKVENKNE